MRGCSYSLSLLVLIMCFCLISLGVMLLNSKGCILSATVKDTFTEMAQPIGFQEQRCQEEGLRLTVSRDSRVGDRDKYNIAYMYLSSPRPHWWLCAGPDLATCLHVMCMTKWVTRCLATMGTGIVSCHTKHSFHLLVCPRLWDLLACGNIMYFPCTT